LPSPRHSQSLLNQLASTGQMSQIALNSLDVASSDGMARTDQVGSFLFVTDAIRIKHLQHLAVKG
jgi:hypothetical protein